MEAWKCHSDIKLLIDLVFVFLIGMGMVLIHYFHGIAQNLPARSWLM
uniref:Uncharacterized protein n=1 Tax=Anguilla anguilla TaxID=7936 RepID=A0A0E9QI56_ANGAN